MTFPDISVRDTISFNWRLKKKGKKFGRFPLERVTFFRLDVYERVGVSLVEVLESVGKTFNAVCERSQKG